MNTRKGVLLKMSQLLACFFSKLWQLFNCIFFYSTTYKKSTHIYSPPVLARGSKVSVCFWVGGKTMIMWDWCRSQLDSRAYLYQKVKRLQGTIVCNGVWWSVLLNCSNSSWCNSSMGQKSTKINPRYRLGTGLIWISV